MKPSQRKSLLESAHYLVGILATEPLESALTDFPPPPDIHIIIVRRPCAQLPKSDSNQTRRDPSPPRAPGRRRATVIALFARLRHYGFIQVRGTPGSGKTTLARLLAHYIHKEERIKVIWVSGWCGKTISNAGGHRRYFKDLGWVEGEKTVFIFDEAQLTYWDVELWAISSRTYIVPRTLRPLSLQAMGVRARASSWKELALI